MPGPKGLVAPNLDPRLPTVSAQPSITRAEVPEDPGTALAEAPPYFLVGCPRSGSTLLRLLLGHHPKLTACEEFEFVTPFLKRAPEAWPCVHRYRAALPCRLDVRLGKLLPLPHHTTFPELANALLWRLARADGGRRIGAVVHHDFEHLPRLWPEARFLHLVRDPRDVTRSCVKMGWFGNPHGAVGMWRAAQRSWRELCTAVDAERRLTVHFEDLVADAERELQRICAFLGVGFDARMLAIEADTSYSRPDPSQCRNWRHSRKLDDIRAVEAALGDELTAAGYQPSGMQPLALTPLRRAWLFAGDRFGRMRAAQRRFGYLLWLGRVGASRLRWPALQRCVQRRWDAIVERDLK